MIGIFLEGKCTILYHDNPYTFFTNKSLAIKCYLIVLNREKFYRPMMLISSQFRIGLRRWSLNMSFYVCQWIKDTRHRIFRKIFSTQIFSRCLDLNMKLIFIQQVSRYFLSKINSMLDIHLKYICRNKHHRLLFDCFENNDTVLLMVIYCGIRPIL